MQNTANGLNIRKLYYSSTEVCNVVQIPIHVLRSWEQKFPYLKSVKSKSGRRLFRPQDLQVVQLIKKLKDEGYSEEDIRILFKHHKWQRLKEQYLSKDEDRIHHLIVLAEVVEDLKEILTLLKPK